MLELAAAMKAEPLRAQAAGGPEGGRGDVRQGQHPHPGVVRGRHRPARRHPLIIDGQASQLGRGETIADTARVLSRYVDAIVWRTVRPDAHRPRWPRPPRSRWSTPSPTSSTPARCSPTCRRSASASAALAGRTLVYLGDGANNMAHSLLLGGATAGMHGADRRPGGLPARSRGAARRQGRRRRDRRRRRAGGRSARPPWTARTSSSPTRGSRWARSATAATGRRRSGRCRSTPP